MNFYVEKLLYLKFGFGWTCFLVHFTMLGPILHIRLECYMLVFWFTTMFNVYLKKNHCNTGYFLKVEITFFWVMSFLVIVTMHISKKFKMISHKFKLTFRIYFWHIFMRLFFLYEFHIHGQIGFSFSNYLVLKIWQIILKLCKFFNSH